MSYQVIFEKKSDDISVDFTLDSNKTINQMALKLYLHNDPSGTVNISLKEDSDLLETVTTTIATMMSTAGLTPGQYHYGYFRFDFSKNLYLKENTTYTIVLNSSSYTYSDSSFLGWCRPHENDPNENSNSLGYKLFGYMKKEDI